MLDAAVIDQSTAERIRAHYAADAEQSGSRLMMALGILGAIITGLGIILIVAHNWDDLSRLTKTIFAFVPMLLGQGLCVFGLLRKTPSRGLHESAAAFTVLAVGACISLVSQIYHIDGDLASFLLTWMLLTLPVLYVMQSSATALLYVAGITYYGCQYGYFEYPRQAPYGYLLLMAGVLPFYLRKLKREKTGNFLSFLNWFIPISLTIVLGAFSDNAEEVLLLGYMSLFGLFSLIALLPPFAEAKPRNNGYGMLGMGGTLVLLLVLTYEEMWSEVWHLSMTRLWSLELLVAGLLTLAGTALILRLRHVGMGHRVEPQHYMFLFFVPLFVLGLTTNVSNAVTNFLVLYLGIVFIQKGTKANHLGWLNFGLLIIAMLAACRFFDDRITFALRGLMFIMVGAGFFVANYKLIKARRKNEE